MVSTESFMGAIVSKFFAKPAAAAGLGFHGWIKACVVACALQAIGGCAWLELKERELVFRATPGQPAGFAGLRAGDSAFALAVPGANPAVPDTLQLWWLPHTDPHAPALLYLHGTFRNLYQNLPKIDALREAGLRPVQLQVPGMRGGGFAVECRRQSLVLTFGVTFSHSSAFVRQPEIG